MPSRRSWFHGIDVVVVSVGWDFAGSVGEARPAGGLLGLLDAMRPGDTTRKRSSGEGTCKFGGDSSALSPTDSLFERRPDSKKESGSVGGGEAALRREASTNASTAFARSASSCSAALDLEEASRLESGCPSSPAMLVIPKLLAGAHSTCRTQRRRRT